MINRCPLFTRKKGRCNVPGGPTLCRYLFYLFTTCWVSNSRPLHLCTNWNNTSPERGREKHITTGIDHLFSLILKRDYEFSRETGQLSSITHTVRDVVSSEMHLAALHIKWKLIEQLNVHQEALAKYIFLSSNELCTCKETFKIHMVTCWWVNSISTLH